MVYSSLQFLFLFLPCLLALYFLAAPRYRNAILVIASLVFYAWGGMDFFKILLGFIAVHWAAGCIVQHLRDRKRFRHMWILVALLVAGDIGLIAWYKYANFFVHQYNSVAQWSGIQPPISNWQNVALPIGISFFTFQAVSYLVDIANGKIRGLRNPIEFALYKALFPQLIAGPIVRYVEIQDQIKNREVSFKDFSDGILRLTHGVTKKVLVADPASLLADAAFSTPTTLTAIEAWIGALAYTVQIYFDFSGYSDMAIGLGRIFGFRFPENFARPYSAKSVTDFWRRWHMTLSRWFRDYLYIPLGGSRKGSGRTYLNLLIVFAATGIWHGANWTFIAWGLWHGAWLLAERLFGLPIDPLGPSIAGRLRVLTAAILGWVVFRADTMSDAWRYLLAMAGGNSARLSVTNLLDHLWWHPIAALLFGTLFMLFGGHAASGPLIDSNGVPRTLRERLLPVACFLGFVASAVTLVAGAASPFLYFRF